MEKREKDYNISELGNWNVAKEFSHFKIMRHLYLADEYTNMAIFGSASLLEELENSYPTDFLKVSGLNRLINVLILLIDNSLFACKKKNSKANMTAYREDLKKILGILPALYKVITRNGQKEFKIIAEKYNPVLEKVMNIKAKINTPLNENNLIFTDKEEFDPKKFKKQVMDDVTTRG